MKKINATLHGLIDYATVAQFAVAPGLLKLSKPHSRIANLFTASFIWINLTTRYPLSIKKVIPFHLHGMLELVWALFFTAAFLSPVKMHKRERLLHLTGALQLFTLIAISDYNDKALTVEGLTDAPQHDKLKTAA